MVGSVDKGRAVDVIYLNIHKAFNTSTILLCLNLDITIWMGELPDGYKTNWMIELRGYWLMGSSEYVQGQGCYPQGPRQGRWMSQTETLGC